MANEPPFNTPEFWSWNQGSDDVLKCPSCDEYTLWEIETSRWRCENCGYTYQSGY